MTKEAHAQVRVSRQWSVDRSGEFQLTCVRWPTRSVAKAGGPVDGVDLMDLVDGLDRYRDLGRLDETFASQQVRGGR